MVGKGKNGFGQEKYASGQGKNIAGLGQGNGADAGQGKDGATQVDKMMLDKKKVLLRDMENRRWDKEEDVLLK